MGNTSAVHGNEMFIWYIWTCTIQVQIKTDFHVYVQTHASAICLSLWTKICSLILRYQDCNKPLHIITNPFLHSIIIQIRNVEAAKLWHQLMWQAIYYLWHMWLCYGSCDYITVLSLQQPRFDPRLVHVQTGVDKVVLGQVSLWILRFSCQCNSTNAPYLTFIYQWHYIMMLATNSIIT